MPTPFYHLHLAQDILEHPGLSRSTRQLLAGHQAAFLFGNTAPDVQVVSHQPRQVTHFFDLPLHPGQPAPGEAMFAAYPSLAQAGALPAEQQAFLAGYLCHLHADWLWVRQIFVPIFGLQAEWGDLSKRIYIHNVLRTVLDQEVRPQLTLAVRRSFEQVHPAHWLTFTEDRYLCQWRDLLQPQLEEHAPSQTVEVFAARQGIAPDEFYALLASPERLQQEVFIHLSRQQITAFRHRLLEESIQIMRRYLEPSQPGSFRQPAAGVIAP